MGPLRIPRTPCGRQRFVAQLPQRDGETMMPASRLSPGAGKPLPHQTLPFSSPVRLGD